MRFKLRTGLCLAAAAVTSTGGFCSQKARSGRHSLNRSAHRTGAEMVCLIYTSKGAPFKQFRRSRRCFIFSLLDRAGKPKDAD
ncbi:hypothetical protein BJV77DRAFT_1035315, partial [Russula vinacea]